jgi:hypothetical protein
MLAPLALVALLIGGTQAAIVVAEDDAAANDRPATVQVETTQNNGFTDS